MQSFRSTGHMLERFVRANPVMRGQRACLFRQKGVAGIADPGVIARTNAAERAVMHQKLMKQLADFLRRADLDGMPVE
jgi:hypothetical protein